MTYVLTKKLAENQLSQSQKKGLIFRKKYEKSLNSTKIWEIITDNEILLVSNWLKLQF